MPNRVPIDHDAIRRALAGRCFICELLAGNSEFAHPILHEDESGIAFLSRYPTVPGYTLVAPRGHREQLITDFSLEEYLSMQRLVYRVGRALLKAVPSERLYVLSVGSEQSNRHVHWHLVPVPPGIPLEEQQFRLLDRNDYLAFTEGESERLVTRIRNFLSSDP